MKKQNKQNKTKKMQKQGGRCMNIMTTRFGEVDVADDKVINFPDGIIGFHSLKNFVLLGKEDRLVMWLQSVDNPKLAFIVVNPFLFEPNYQPEISEVERLEDLHLVSIVVVPEDPEKMTANLLGPIAINVQAKVGKQVILLDSEYSVKHTITRADAREMSEMVN